MNAALAGSTVAIAVPVVAVLGIALVAGGAGATSSPQPASTVTTCPGQPVQAGKPIDGVTLDSAQVDDAQVIYDVSVSTRLPQQAAVIAIATSMQESSLLNKPYGTSDSLGLFQQRPSQGWGTPAQIMDPVYAATKFYEALTAIPNWQSLPLSVAAQDVQGSGHPSAYAKWQPLAGALVATFNGTATDCATDNSSGVPSTGTTQVPAGFALPASTPPQVVIAISYALQQLGKPYIWGGTGPAGYDCSGLVMMAYQAAGISLPRTTFQQVDQGTPVYSLSHLLPGDLIFTAGSDGTPSNPGHVGMYIGDGQVIQAPKTNEKIDIMPLNPYWSTEAVAIRRIS